jgi:hypothetical protein
MQGLLRFSNLLRIFVGFVWTIPISPKVLRFFTQSGLVPVSMKWGVEHF